MTVERTSDRDLTVTRRVHAPRALVFEAWRNPDLFRRWWVPASAPITLISCEMDVRTGGSYRLVFTHPAAPEPMAFFGRYLEVVPAERLVWTNEESGADAQVITTVTFEDDGAHTRVIITDRYPSQAALDEAIATESLSWNEETFTQLDALLAHDRPA